MITASMTREQAIKLVQTAIAEDIQGEVECAWKDHWQQITEHASAELKLAIQLLTGKSVENSTGAEFDVSLKVDVLVT